MRYSLDTSMLYNGKPLNCHWCSNRLANLRHIYKGKNCERYYCSDDCCAKGEDRALRYRATLAGQVHLHWTATLAAILSVLMLAFIVTGGTRAWAQEGHHGIGHAENHDWYRELKQPDTGYSCCNGTTSDHEGDCRPTRVWQNDDGTYTALADGQQVIVEPGKLLRNKDGTPWIAPDQRAHLCRSKSGVNYCLISAPPKS